MSVSELAPPICSLLLGDCAASAPFNADAIVTDPPYQIGKAWKRAFHGRRGKSPLWGKDQVWDELHPIVPELPNMADVCVIWGGNFYPLPPSRCWMVWDKLQENRGADCELAWVQADIAPKVFRMSRIDAYVNKAEGLKKTHPAQKPLPLMEWCLRQLKLPKGATVCDPFMGSGTTGVACVRLGLGFIGYEKDPAHFETACHRIAEAGGIISANVKVEADGAASCDGRASNDGLATDSKRGEESTDYKIELDPEDFLDLCNGKWDAEK